MIRKPHTSTGPRRGIPAAVLVAVAAAGLSAGYVAKAQCLDRDWDGVQFRRLCYNDVQPLYLARALNEGRFPYIHSTAETRAAGQDLEYPAGTGIYLGVVASAAETPAEFFNASALGLATMGLAATAALAAMALEPRRVLLFAVGPAMIMYAFQNWDLLAVGLATLAMFAYSRRADGWAGLLLGLGAATKLYPAVLLPALALDAWKRERHTPWRMTLAFAAGVVLLNLPLMIANFSGWKYPWDFQLMRPANYETSWFMLYRHFPTLWFRESTFVNLLSLATFVVATSVLIALEARRERPRPFALGFGILVAFLLTAKVFSPQYALWLLPFFAVLRLPWWSYVLWAVTDAAVWISVSAYFLAAQFHDLNREPDWRVIAVQRLDILEAAVWARYAVLLILLVLSTRTDELVRETNARTGPVPLTA